MPDLLNYWLTGVERNEVTISSTSQFYDAKTRRFATDMLESARHSEPHPGAN